MNNKHSLKERVELIDDLLELFVESGGDEPVTQNMRIFYEIIHGFILQREVKDYKFEDLSSRQGIGNLFANLALERVKYILKARSKDDIPHVTGEKIKDRVFSVKVDSLEQAERLNASIDEAIEKLIANEMGKSVVGEAESILKNPPGGGRH